MKISEMTNDQATDTLIRLSAPFENLCNDDEVDDALEKISKLGGMPLIKAIGQIIPIIATIGLRKHKNDLYEIVAALTQNSVTKIGKMNFKETVNALQESYDEILRDFFTRTAIAQKISEKR